MSNASCPSRRRYRRLQTQKQIPAAWRFRVVLRGYRKYTRSTETRRQAFSGEPTKTEPTRNHRATERAPGSTRLSTRRDVRVNFEEPSLEFCGNGSMDASSSSGTVRLAPQRMQDPLSVGFMEVQFLQCHCNTEALEPIATRLSASSSG
ncbi:hypothetical protein MTO96_017349 [Rhipicephalus appendiculatus]